MMLRRASFYAIWSIAAAEVAWFTLAVAAFWIDR